MDKYVNKYKNETGATVYYIKETSCCENRVEWLRGENSERCPHCGDIYYRKPNLENKLFNLQDKFVAEYEATGNSRILGEQMFPLIHEYAINLIKALIKGKKSLDYDELSARAWDASTLLIEVIMKDPEHRMKYSFGKYLGDLCKSVCYSTKNHEHTFSLNAIMKDNKTSLKDTIIAKVNDTSSNGYEIEEREIRMNNSIEFQLFKEDTFKKITELIEKTANALYKLTGNLHDKLLYIQGLSLKMSCADEKLITGFFEEAGKSIKNYVEKGELVIFSELKESCS